MKKTNKKFSLGMKIASALTCLVITAVGFASWLVIKPAEAATDNGSFTVYAVETQGVTITVTKPDSVTNNIVFGKGETTNAHPWLVAQNVDDEAMTATFNVTVSTGTDTSILLNSVADEIKVTFDVKDDIATNFDAAIGEYLAAPTVTLSAGATGSATYATNGNAVVSVDAPASNTMSFTVTVTFGWGTKTNGQNPYTFFNAITSPTADNITAAENMLEAIAAIGTDTIAEAFSLKVETAVTPANNN